MVTDDWSITDANLQDRIMFGIAQVCVDGLLGGVGVFFGHDQVCCRNSSYALAAGIFVFVVRWVLNLVYKVIRGRNFWAQEYGSHQILFGRSNERNLDERGACSTHVREKRDMN